MRSRVGVIIVNNRDHRQLLARHIPKRSRSEDKRTVADETNDLLVWPRKLHSRRSPNAGTQMRAVIEEQFAPAKRIEIEAVKTDRAGFVHDDSVFVSELSHFKSESVSQ